MDPITVRDEDYAVLFEMQKSVQVARLDNDTDLVKEREKELTARIYELYPECCGRSVRFDVSGRKIYVWG
ncbi:MAG: hypothetical protein IH874_00335 [Candidatus Dadabacteria bacterium]|nr:hypothetical protein [Candidatus Dadabacteria bacterium]